MTTFLDFLRERIESSGFSTEDALISFLPLMRQSIAAHAREQVASFDNINKLQVEGVQLWFEETHLRQPLLSTSRVKTIQRPRARAVELVGESQSATDVDGKLHDLSIGNSDLTEVEHPLYIPGYVA